MIPHIEQGALEGLPHAIDPSGEASRLHAEVEELQAAASQHRRLLNSLQGSTQAVLQELDTKALMGAFARAVAQITTAEWVLVSILDQDKLLAGASQPDGYAEALFEHHRSLLERSLLRKQPQVLKVPADSSEDQGNPRTLVLVPILDHKRQLIGLMLSQCAGSFDIFRQEIIQGVEILSMQFSTAYSRSKLFDRLSDWSKSLEMLLAFNAAINQHLVPAELVKRLVENAATFLKADGGTAGLAIPACKDGELAMSSESYFYQGKWHDFARQWKRNDGVPGYILENEFVYLSNNYPADPIADSESIARFNLQHVLCVPIKDVGGKLLGFFALHKGPRSLPFTWQDAAFLESLGNSTAVAIQNAQLLKTLEVKNTEIRALSANHVRHLEEERRHIARELHDEAGQLMIGIKLSLQVLARKVPAELGELSAELDRLRGLVNQSSTQLRDLARNLRPPTLDQLGLDMVMRQLALDHEQRSGIRISLAFENLPATFPDPIKTALYRIAQEALTNAARYSEATQVSMKMRQEGECIYFCLQDNGVGFDTTAATAGLGLLGMKERAGMLNGQLTVRSSREEGTEICVMIPIPPTAQTTDSTAATVTNANGE